jgi:hypothetical protein
MEEKEPKTCKNCLHCSVRYLHQRWYRSRELVTVYTCGLTGKKVNPSMAGCLLWKSEKVEAAWTPD